MGTAVTLVPQPAPRQTFIGWRVNGRSAGWAVPLALTLDAARTVAATFVAAPRLPGVGAGDPAAVAVAQLRARGTIRGDTDGTYGPGDRTLRARMAALLARAMGWSGAGAGNPFSDRLAPADVWGR